MQQFLVDVDLIVHAVKLLSHLKLAPSALLAERSFLSEALTRSWREANAPAFKQPHLLLLFLLTTSLSSLVSSPSPYAPSASPHPQSLSIVAPYCHSLPSLDALVFDMKIKKLVTALVSMQLTAVAALMGSGSAAYYGNSSVPGTAVIAPYVLHLFLLFCFPLLDQSFHL